MKTYLEVRVIKKGEQDKKQDNPKAIAPSELTEESIRKIRKEWLEEARQSKQKERQDALKSFYGGEVYA